MLSPGSVFERVYFGRLHPCCFRISYTRDKTDVLIPFCWRKKGQRWLAGAWFLWLLQRVWLGAWRSVEQGIKTRQLVLFKTNRIALSSHAAGPIAIPDANPHSRNFSWTLWCGVVPSWKYWPSIYALDYHFACLSALWPCGRVLPPTRGLAARLVPTSLKPSRNKFSVVFFFFFCLSSIPHLLGNSWNLPFADPFISLPIMSVFVFLYFQDFISVSSWEVNTCGWSAVTKWKAGW